MAINSAWWVMVRMSLPELINQHDGQILLDMAGESIKLGLHGGAVLHVDPSRFSDSLSRPGASFVTLMLNGQLRGCIGHLVATQALLQDVVENARLAAFKDTRFAPLTAEEFDAVELSISILSSAEPIQFKSEADLMDKIRPDIDGLILKQGANQGTFLPSVWASLPEPVDFLRHLKQKAGLSADYWSDQLQVFRYTTQHIKPPS